jgi:hypothetical protein
MIPYRDYFDNHSPLFHLLCAPLFALLGVRPDIVIPMRCAIAPQFSGRISLGSRVLCLHENDIDAGLDDLGDRSCFWLFRIRAGKPVPLATLIRVGLPIAAGILALPLIVFLFFAVQGSSGQWADLDQRRLSRVGPALHDAPRRRDSLFALEHGRSPGSKFLGNTDLPRIRRACLHCG